MRENSVLKLREVMGGDQTNIYCQGTVCRKCVLAALLAVKFGLSLEIKQNHRRILKKKKLFFLPI